jgi:hypothetical protein
LDPDDLGAIVQVSAEDADFPTIVVAPHGLGVAPVRVELILFNADTTVEGDDDTTVGTATGLTNEPRAEGSVVVLTKLIDNTVDVWYLSGDLGT